MPGSRQNKAASAAPHSGALPNLAILLSVVGAVLAVVTLNIHYQLASSQDYTSFCDVSEGLSCDAVLTSGWATFLGVPIAAWGGLSYLVTAALAFLLRKPDEERVHDLALVFVGVTGAMLVISLYFLAISTFAIEVACPMCLSLDAVNLALLGTALAIWRTVGDGGDAGRRNTILGGFAAASVVAVAALGVMQEGRGSDAALAGPISIDSIKRKDPKFYAWYISQENAEMPYADAQRAEAEAHDGITIVEFSDFECPHCRRAFHDLHSVLGVEKDVRVFHRNYPLNADCNDQVKSKLHANACQAAVASECATRQGQGSAYNGLLFGDQANLSPEAFLRFAKKLRLDQAAFEACLASEDAKAAVAADVAAGNEAGVESTPTFFINGRRLKGGMQRPIQYRYAFAIERVLAARKR